MKALIHLDWKSKLNKLGIDTTDYDNYQDRIEKKSITRYLYLANQSVKYIAIPNTGSKINIDKLNKLYITDILIRREVFRLLTTIEVNLKAAIAAEFNNELHLKTIEVLNDLQVKILSSTTFASLGPDKRAKVQKDFNTIFSSKDIKHNELFADFIDKCDISIVNLFIHLLQYHNTINLERWYNGSFTIKDLSSNLSKIVNIRNAVMHHNVCMHVQKNKQQQPGNILEDFLNYVIGIFGEDSEAIDSFNKNWYRIYNKSDYNLSSIENEIRQIYSPCARVENNNKPLFDLITIGNDKKYSDLAK